MPKIHHAIIIAASPEIVYDALSSQPGLSAWWTPQSTTTGAIGTIARFPFGNNYYKEMKIEELNPAVTVRWTCIKGEAEWLGTTIRFNLHSGDDKTLAFLHPEIQGQLEQQKVFKIGTLLHFQHDNWKEYSAMFAECSYTWALFLRSLKLYCETGKGNPWPDQHRN